MFVNFDCYFSNMKPSVDYDIKLMKIIKIISILFLKKVKQSSNVLNTSGDIFLMNLIFLYLLY